MLLAHGAGADMNHSFMQTFSDAIVHLHGLVVRFNFPYITRGRKLPGSQQEAVDAIDEMVKDIRRSYPELPLILCGKSYGGRMMSHWATNKLTPMIRGLIYLGFPLHATGKEGKERAAHLTGISIPQLFLQGTNDLLARADLLSEVIGTLQHAQLHSIRYADHSFKIPKKFATQTHSQLIGAIAGMADEWILNLLN